MNAVRNWQSEQAVMASSAAGRESLITQSYQRVTARALIPAWSDPAEALWHLPAAVVAHGIEDDPIFFYGNRAALELFEMSAEDFIKLPSRMSAEPLEREERKKLMERVTRENFIDDYSGVRVSAGGQRFRIEQATVWNLLAPDGALNGQAAVFSDWIMLD